ncbi:MAG TPA: hypothetical protein VI488_17985 [Candidatus Angelobacter sp.]
MNNSMETVAALNLPAGLVQLPYAIVSADKNDLMPSGMDLRVWRAITWPILGMVFWWIAGRGAEALVAAQQGRLVPRIGWLETTIAFLLLAAGTTFVVGFVFFSGVDLHDLTLQLFMITAILWAFLGSLTVAAKIAQGRLKRKLQPNTQVAA